MGLARRIPRTAEDDVRSLVARRAAHPTAGRPIAPLPQLLLRDVVATLLAPVRPLPVQGALGATADAQRSGPAAATRDGRLLDNAVIAVRRPAAQVVLHQCMLRRGQPPRHLLRREQQSGILLPFDLSLRIQIGVRHRNSRPHVCPDHGALKRCALLQPLQL